MQQVRSTPEMTAGPALSSVALSTLEPGDSCRVVAVTGTTGISRRLREMGLVPGVTLRIVKTAPFGDPFEIRLLGYNLALRRSEAELVEVTA